MANVTFFSPDGGTTRYLLEDTEGRTTYEEEIHGVNLFDDSKIEVGTAWNGDTNANRARNIIPCEPNSEYIVSMNGTNGLDAVFFSVSASVPPASQTTITSFPYTIMTGASDRYITFGFNKTDIALSDVTALKIMLRKAEIEDSPYRPYNQQSIQHQINDITGVTGVRNLLENTATTQTINGVTFTVNADKSVTVNGTATASITNFYLKQNLSLKAGTYYLSGNPAGVGDDLLTGLRIFDSTYEKVNIFFQHGRTFTLVEDMDNLQVIIRVNNAVTLTNAVFKPMIRLASDPSDEYVPHAMTNRELTEVKTGAITVGTNCSFVSTANICAKVGNVKMIMQQVKVPSISAGSWQTLATVGDEMKPLLGKDITFLAYLNTSNIHLDAWLRVSTGVIEVRPNANVSADSYVFIVLTYI